MISLLIHKPANIIRILLHQSRISHTKNWCQSTLYIHQGYCFSHNLHETKLVTLSVTRVNPTEQLSQESKLLEHNLQPSNICLQVLQRSIYNKDIKFYDSSNINNFWFSYTFSSRYIFFLFSIITEGTNVGTPIHQQVILISLVYSTFLADPLDLRT